jgi:hypothetical protein
MRKIDIEVTLSTEPRKPKETPGVNKNPLLDELIEFSSLLGSKPPGPTIL